MKDNQESVMKMFNLPSYTKNKTFAEASKAINDRYKGQDDPDSQATLAELQGRLQQAQEYVKKQSEPSTPTDPEMDQNQNFLGGDKDGGGAGGYASAATGALELGQMAFGKTGIDTSGASAAPEVQSKGGAALGGAAKGAQAGMAFGPWGAAIGGVVGGVAGLIGRGKAAEDANEADIQHTGMLDKKNNNPYYKGGKLNKYEGGGLEDEMYDPNDVASFVQDVDDRSYLNNLTKSLDEPEVYSGVNEFVNKVDARSAEKTAHDAAQDTAQDDPAKFNPGKLLRYAPAAMNAAQLLGLKKPKQEGRDRLGNVYEKNYVDEKSLQNVVGQDVAGMRDRIVSASGGSGSTARANLLASQLKGTQALSDAYIKAEGVNRAEDTKAQDFKLNVDERNLIQSNLAKEINARNKGAYDTQKSKLLAQLGDDLGGVGQEELFKEFPELMGMDFNTRGEYIKKIQADKAKKKAAKKLAKAAKNV